MASRGLWRPSPGGDIEGDCTTTGTTVSCTTGGALVDPTLDPDDRWRLVVDLTATDPAPFTITHTVTSPHLEPDPDRWANQDVVDGWAARAALVFEPVGPVEVGETFTVTADVGRPPLLRGVLLDERVPGITILDGGCPGNPVYPPGCSPDAFTPPPPFTFTLRADQVDDDAYFGATLSSEIGYASGSVSFRVINPRITSDVHPDLEAPAGGVVGEQAEIAGVVRNAGSTAQQDVTLDLALPSSVVVDQATWSVAGLPCDLAATTVSCRLGTIDPYTAIPVALTLVPQSAGPVSLTATVTSDTAQDVPDTHPDRQTLTFPVDEAFADLGVTVAVDPDPPVLDVALELTATVTNHGTVDATGVDLELEVPAGMPVTTAEVLWPLPPGSTECTVAGQVVTCPLGTFAPGATHVVRVSADVPTTVSGTLEATVAADQPEPAPDPHPNVVTRPLTTGAPNADLELRLSPGFVAPSVVNEPRTMEVEVVNWGPSDVAGAELSIDVPARWDIQSALPDEQHGSCSTSGQVVTCHFESMYGGGGNREHEAGRRASGCHRPAQSSCCSVTADLPDPGPSPNEQTATIQVLPQEVDLDLSSDSPAEAPAGLDTVTVAVRNRGPATAHDVVLTATFPDSVEIESALFFHSGWTCDVAEHALTCQAETMHPLTYDLYVRVRHTALGPVSYELAISSALPEVSPDVGPNTLMIDRTVVPGPGDISGSVLGPTVGVPWVIVRAYRVTDGLQPTATTATFYDGRFSFTRLPPGEYRIRFGSAGRQRPARRVVAGPAVEDRRDPLVVDGLHEAHVLDAVLDPL